MQRHTLPHGDEDDVVLDDGGGEGDDADNGGGEDDDGIRKFNSTIPIYLQLLDFEEMLKGFPVEHKVI